MWGGGSGAGGDGAGRAGRPTNEHCGVRRERREQTRQERGAQRAACYFVMFKAFSLRAQNYNYPERDWGDWLKLRERDRAEMKNNDRGKCLKKSCTMVFFAVMLFVIWEQGQQESGSVAGQSSAGRTSRHEMDYTHSRTKRNKERQAKKHSRVGMWVRQIHKKTMWIWSKRMFWVSFFSEGLGTADDTTVEY